MADGFEYEIGLKDGVEGPSARIVSALDAMNRALQRIDQSTREAQSGIDAVGRAARQAHGGAHTMASGISFAVRGFDDLARGGKYAANGILDVGKAFTRLGPLLAGAALVGGTAALAKYAFEVSEAREQTILAYDAFQGEGKGAGTFKLIDDLAQSVHAPAEKVQGMAKELLELGLENNTALSQTVRAVTDLQRVGLEGGARKVQALVERSLAAGHFVLGKGGAGASRALTGTGISEKDLAAQLGLSPKKLEAELKAGKITVEEGIAAVDRAIIEGKVGALATKKFTVSDAFADLHNSVRKLFQESDDSPITDSLRRLTQGFEDGTDGARIMQDVVDGIFKGVGLAIDGVRKLGDVFKDVAETTLDAWDSVDDFIAGVGKSQEEKEKIARDRRLANHKRHLGEAVDDQSRAFEKVQHLAQSGASKREILDTAKRLGIEVSVLDPTGRTVPKGTREAISAERSSGGVGSLVVDRETAAFTNPYAALRDAQRAGTVGASGQNAVNIDEWEPKLHKLGQEAGKALHDGAAGPQGLDAHSPSKKMFDLGVDAADGLQSGTQQAMSSSTTVNTGKSVVLHVHPGALHVEVHEGMRAEDFAPLLESQLADVFERAALELGT